MQQDALRRPDPADRQQQKTEPCNAEQDHRRPRRSAFLQGCRIAERQQQQDHESGEMYEPELTVEPQQQAGQECRAEYRVNAHENLPRPADRQPDAQQQEHQRGLNRRRREHPQRIGRRVRRIAAEKCSQPYQDNDRRTLHGAPAV